MPYMCGAVTACRPVVAGVIVAIVKCGTVNSRAGKNIVPVRAVARAIYNIAIFINSSLLIDIGFFAMQIIDIVCDKDTVCVVPEPITDTVSCVDTVGAQIRTPIA